MTIAGTHSSLNRAGRLRGTLDSGLECFVFELRKLTEKIGSLRFKMSACSYGARFSEHSD